MVGQNTLYFNVTNKSKNNTKGSSGLMFGATLTTTAIPAPNTISLLALGLLFLLMFGYRQKLFAAAVKK